MDVDKDGVGDHLDKCPGTTPGQAVDEMGCPKESKARGVLRGVTFTFGSTELTPNATIVLDGVADELKKYENVNAEVQGHTDSHGPEGANLALSAERAQSVLDYLVQRGVPADRLTSKGYGETMPIAENSTPEGRAQNRRVELKWLETETE
jgi:outer membrane protein OmpA-like peptidoglycan-associated protein